MKASFFITLFMLHATLTHAEPWLSKPLLSESAIVTPIGHGWLKLSAQKAYNTAFYNIDYNRQSLPLAIDDSMYAHVNYGITKSLETAFILSYIHNETQGEQHGNLGDTTVSLTKQLMRQHENTWPPDMTLTLLEVIPTGHYDQLNPNLYGTDATGQGSYLTNISLAMEHLNWLGGEHYFVQFATLTLIYPSRVNLHGPSIYGGGRATDGTIWPGNSIAVNLVGEYTLNQSLGLIIEGYIYAQKASHFQGRLGAIEPRFEHKNNRHSQHGNTRRGVEEIIFNRLRPSFLNLGSVQNIGHGNVAQFTLAPAVYYSFTKHMTLTGGAWFTVAGKNTPAFYSPKLQFVAQW